MILQSCTQGFTASKSLLVTTTSETNLIKEIQRICTDILPRKTWPTWKDVQRHQRQGNANQNLTPAAWLSSTRPERARFGEDAEKGDPGALLGMQTGVPTTTWMNVEGATQTHSTHGMPWRGQNAGHRVSRAGSGEGGDAAPRRHRVSGGGAGGTRCGTNLLPLNWTLSNG